MSDLLNKITDNLQQHKSVVIVGRTDSGKTYWVKNTLIPHLESLGKRVEYLKDGSELPKESPDIVICDEVETMFDEAYLHGKDINNVYSAEYLEKVKGWVKNYSKLPVSTLFVITRNSPDEINNLVLNFKKADWDNRDITVLEFEK